MIKLYALSIPYNQDAITIGIHTFGYVPCIRLGQYQRKQLLLSVQLKECAKENLALVALESGEDPRRYNGVPFISLYGLVINCTRSKS